MKLNKKIIIIIIGAFLLLASLIYLININSNSKIEESDAMKFKKEYESLNGVLNETTGKISREISINDNNQIVYSNLEEILNKIDNKESFVVYFGFSSCPWCRSILESLLYVANVNNVKEIYYVDVKDIRDVYTIENDEVVLIKKASKNYYDVLEKLDSVLSDYKLTDKDGNEIMVGEKRIYAPNVVAIVNGEAKEMQTGISNKQTDPYMVLTDEIIEDTKKQFEKVFKYISLNNCNNKGC